MAQSYTGPNGQRLLIPGAYQEWKEETQNSGLGTTGILVLIGEADAGPDFSLEEDLDSNKFGPDQLSDVIAKYKSGNLVDAFKMASNPSNDPDIQGAPQGIILVKTNVSTRASGSLSAWSGSYPDFQDASLGALGNSISYTVSANVSEVVPATDAFTFIPSVDTVNLAFRVNGGSAVTASLTASASGSLTVTPTQFVSTVNALSGVAATGGVNRNIITVSGTLAVDANPSLVGANYIDLTRSVAWAVTPTVGDTLYIPASSPVAGGSDENVGCYVITAASSTVIRALKLSDAGGTGVVAGVITAPVDVAAASIAATTDAVAYSPVVISLEAGDPIPGIGKSLEIADLGTGNDLFSRCAFDLGTDDVVAWISEDGSPQLLVSDAEYQAKIDVARQSDGIQESYEVGGDVALKVSYEGTSGSITIDQAAGTFSTTVVGGSGASISAKKFKDFATVADVVSYLNSQTGYSASAGTALLGQRLSTDLDSGTFNIGSSWGAQNCRVKVDAADIISDIASSQAVRFDPDDLPIIGVPKPSALAFLSGGAKGGSTAAQVAAAFTACESVDANFVVPLFSRDASSDIAAGLTESSSTYAVSTVAALLRDHCTRMAQYKVQKNRQGIASISDTFSNQKLFAANIASLMVGVAFLDAKALDSNGDLVQFQPWMGAVNAAALQLAGFTKGIVKKLANVSGVVHPFPSTYNMKNSSHIEQALLAGLLPMRKAAGGGFEWVSDQTSYGQNSIVYNSLQGVYVANVAALTFRQRMEDAFVGQNLADVARPVALAFAESVLDDFLRLKFIAPSDGAPRGFAGLKVRINGNAMEVECQLFLNTLLYFVPIKFTISKVVQS